MNRLERIQGKVATKSGNQSGMSTGNMQIPGMKIGTQISPGGPSYEDITWLIEKVQKVKAFISSASFSKKEDLMQAEMLFKEIEDGK